MGKRKSNKSTPFTGLGAFVQVLQSTSQTELEPSTTPAHWHEPPTKKRRLSPTPTQHATSWIAKYDLSTSKLVPSYTQESDVPEKLRKYFHQRYRYFSLYDEGPGCLLDEEGWFSVTPEGIADQIAWRFLDAFCGVGGNAIAFARAGCARVIALDTSATRLALARHNAQIYGVAEYIEFILCDYVSFAKSYIARTSSKRKIDIIFLSPPWGGPEYLSGSPLSTPKSEEEEHPTYHLTSLLPLPGKELFDLSRRITRNIAYYLPRNTDLGEVGALVGMEEQVEVEEEWMNSKLKALTCYFGGLVQGQEEIFWT
ncbi:putative diacylglycerol O-acyltransferase tgs1 [Paramarasmius palmivorus]|uniref:Trimethylguanosine synthase n=1 Tax=Paramarasmius palmivorus TaxID=297713 RepID=A0AAW0CQF5_9AGAR